MVHSFHVSAQGSSITFNPEVQDGSEMSLPRKPVDDGFYLVMDLGLPLGMTGWPNEAQRLAFSLSSTDITVQSGYLWDKDRLPPKTSIPKVNGHDSLQECGRFIFQLQGGIRNDAHAQDIVDAAWAVLAVIYQVLLQFHETPTALWLPRRILKNNLLIRRRDILDLDAAAPAWERMGEHLLSLRMGTAHLFPFTVVDEMWRVLPSVLANRPLLDACHFYQASIREFCFLGDSISEILEDRAQSPISRSDRTRTENAVLNAFKAVEAIIGDPPKDEGKFRNKLAQEGIDPNELCGFGRRSEWKPLAEQIRTLNCLRDKKAGHGRSSGDRTISYFQVMEAQLICRHLVLLKLSELKKKTPELIVPKWLRGQETAK